MREIFLGMLGLCMGTTIASGVVAFIISLGIVPRFAGITGSAAQVRLYEECSMLGAVLGNVVFLYQRALPLGNPGLAVYGSFSGIFLGSWDTKKEISSASAEISTVPNSSGPT